MSEEQALDKLLHSIATFLHFVFAWLVVVGLGAPWWSFLAGALLAVLWRGWQFWRAR